MWFDSHCHLTMLEPDPAEVVEAAARAGVTGLLTVGVTVADSQEAATVAASFPSVWATAGVHPHEAKAGIEGLSLLLDDPNIVAVGECGLDYYYDHSPRRAQVEVFKAQIGLANARDLALVIHTRDSWPETLDLLDDEGIPRRTVFHCFTGGVDEATACLARGAYLSFSGIVTFKTATDLREAALITPLDRLLIETDSPYLAPIPHRGRPNEPAHVAIVGEFLAELRGEPVETLAEATTANASALFRSGS
ncbi:MAG: TatD family hydrolase [Actinomycetia bacterium]|nr:TatD family hydrolase [Actinomycetes bacterium]MCP4226592.1 TatD family hydrolase [Actinomycetes bacterium]MCP5030180.1 TatD family hydrolase [Actinomycetes bacterium]